MRRLLCGLVIVVLAAACSGADDPEPTRDATTPTATPERVLAPLTGLEVDDAGVLDRPVLAVKIDNHPRALPQSGIDAADIAINELVEGGATRFIALFHSTDPGTVGPVRSGREVDADLMPAFNPVFAYSGAAAPVVEALRAAGLFLRTEGDAGWSRRRRETAREHTLYLSAEEQWQAGSDLPPAEEPWPFDGEPPEGGEDVEGMDLLFSPQTVVNWEWDGQRFVRSQYGEPHVTESGERVGADNVIVPTVEVRPGPRGGLTVEIDVIGEGEALLFRDGMVHQARWRKASAEQHFEWLTPEGAPLPLAPGQTWIELMPVEGSTEIHRPAPEGTAEPGATEQPDGAAGPSG